MNQYDDATSLLSSDSDSEFENLDLERDDVVLHVRINRPRVLNALDDKTLNAIASVFSLVNKQDDIRVVVLSGTGRAFSSGADLRQPPGRPATGISVRRRRNIAETGRRACQAIAACSAATIARTHGHVIGGGVLLALSCDFRVGADNTVFSLPEVELGQPLSWGGTPLLIKEIGAARAREMIMMCRRICAIEAQQIGLLHAVVSPTALDEEVRSWSIHLSGLPEPSLATAKNQFERYARAARLADLTETDSDIFTAIADMGGPGPVSDMR